MNHRYFSLGPVTFRARPATLGVLLLTLAVVIVLGLTALSLGSYRLSWPEILSAFTGGGQNGGRARFIVITLRLPRILTALLAGGLLGVSGWIFQGVIRNPLASPDIIGINQGASAAAAFWIIQGFNLSLLPLAALGGALAAAITVYLFSYRRHLSLTRLILVGVGVNAMAASLTLYMMQKGRVNDAERVYRWMAGSLHASGWSDVRLLALGALVILPVTGLLLRSFRVLQLGDETACGVGLRTEALRLFLLVLGCAFSAQVVSVVGPVGFLALMVPHPARRIGGEITGGSLLLSALFGGLLLLGADMVAQHALPVNLPAGIPVSALGAPYLLFHLFHGDRR